MTAAPILSLTDARRAIRLPDADTSKDGELQDTYIQAATSLVERIIEQPVIIRTCVESFNGGGAALVLTSPASSVTSVTQNGTALVLGAGYVLSHSRRVIKSGSNLRPWRFWPGQDNIVVTYQAGLCADLASVPVEVKLAARKLLRWLHEADNNGARGDTFGESDVDLTDTPAGKVPTQVVELLSGYMGLGLG